MRDELHAVSALNALRKSDICIATPHAAGAATSAHCDLVQRMSRAACRVYSLNLQLCTQSPLAQALCFAQLTAFLRHTAKWQACVGVLQQGYGQSTVAGGVESGYRGLDKSFKEISARLKKHLATTPKLLSIAWAAIESSIVRQLEQFETDLAAAYPEVSVPVPSTQVARLLQGANPM